MENKGDEHVSKQAFFLKHHTLITMQIWPKMTLTTGASLIFIATGGKVIPFSLPVCYRWHILLRALFKILDVRQIVKAKD